MELSSRNQLKGTITGIQLGGVMAEITIDVTGQELVSVITRKSRGYPQRGFSRASRSTSKRTCRLIIGRPGLPCGCRRGVR
jgi:hypothetical protein